MRRGFTIVSGECWVGAAEAITLSAVQARGRPQSDHAPDRSRRGMECLHPSAESAAAPTACPVTPTTTTEPTMRRGFTVVPGECRVGAGRGDHVPRYKPEGDHSPITLSDRPPRGMECPHSSAEGAAAPTACPVTPTTRTASTRVQPPCAQPAAAARFCCMRAPRRAPPPPPPPPPPPSPPPPSPFAAASVASAAAASPSTPCPPLPPLGGAAGLEIALTRRGRTSRPSRALGSSGRVVAGRGHCRRALSGPRISPRPFGRAALLRALSGPLVRPR